MAGYSYDRTGDRLSKATTGIGPDTYQHQNGTHRLINITGAEPSARAMDANGNTTAMQANAWVYGFGYDDRNRMAVVQQNRLTIAKYFFNGRGERVRKQGVNGANGRNYVYDEAGHLLAEYSDQRGPSTDYVWADGVLVALYWGNPSAGPSLLRYAWTDGLGTPRALTGSEGGTVMWAWPATRNPFGERAASGFNSVMNLRYPGQYYDDETGLHYNYFRDYEPSAGRYLQSDPIGLNAGISTYAYGSSRPLAALDPKGLSTQWSGSVVSGGLTVGFGGRLLYFHLTSECKCNRQYDIRGYASFLTFGGGVSFKPSAQIGDLGGSGASATFEDEHSDCPNPDVANGPAWMGGINLMVGGGYSIFSTLGLGHLRSHSIISGPMIGLDVSAVATIYGQSVVLGKL